MHSAHVAGRDRPAFHRTPDGDDHLALDQGVWIRKGQRRQAADLVDLDHRHPGLTVVVDQARVMRLGVARNQDGHAAGARDHVDVGDDVAIGGREVA